MKSHFKILLFFFALFGNIFVLGNNINGVEPEVVLLNKIISANYNYFSNVLVYPLKVSNNINILNGGTTSFKFYIFDSSQKLIMTLDSSPYCSSIINIESFDEGKYIIKADNQSESHQFTFYKN